MKTEKKWILRSCNKATKEFLKSELLISDLMAELLAARGIEKKIVAEQFLAPRFSHLINPLQFIDMDKASARIAQAVISREKIGIFGDYDVDGVCSAALLQQFLLMLKADVVATLPHRMTEGYGLSIQGVDRLNAKGAQIIITVDCGISAHDQIDYANSLNREVIVVDHHEVGQTLPKAYAVINPKRNDCPSQASYLCAAGVTFFLCLAIRKYLREAHFFTEPEPDVRHLLDLVSLATVCDVVPLVHNNRLLTKAGLAMIKQKKRIGLSALMDVCGIDSNKISSTNLGFHLGPRINAAGRLEDAHTAFDLLLEADVIKAQNLARQLHETNSARKDLEESITDQATVMVMNNSALKDAKALVLYDESWHPGVVGIVASRIAERFHRPAIIIGEKGKGSGRSIKGIDLHAMVSKSAQTLAGFGGHAHAIGLTLGPLGVEQFRHDLVAVIHENVAEDIFVPQLFYDAELGLDTICFDLIDELSLLEPYGAKNPSPLFRINRCFVRNLKRLNGGHIKGELESAQGILEFIGFRMDISDQMAHAAVDVLGVIEKNEWLGSVRIQLRLVDIKKSPA